VVQTVQLALDESFYQSEFKAPSISCTKTSYFTSSQVFNSEKVILQSWSCLAYCNCRK